MKTVIVRERALFAAGLLLIELLVGLNTFAGAPTIFSFTPGSGATGTSVTISGANFSPVAINNTVYFGAVRASVLSASSNRLTVGVPSGATYAPITATVSGLTAQARSPSVVTFPGT